jgi:hypothetical protein
LNGNEVIQHDVEDGFSAGQSNARKFADAECEVDGRSTWHVACSSFLMQDGALPNGPQLLARAIMMKMCRVKRVIGDIEE